MPLRSSKISQACSANLSPLATAAEEAKRRGRPRKRQVDSAARTQIPDAEQTGPPENGRKSTEATAGASAGEGEAGGGDAVRSDGGERPGHLFQYPDGASEASFLQYETSKAASYGLAEYVARLATEAVEARTAFTIVLSGGSLIQVQVFLADTCCFFALNGGSVTSDPAMPD